MTNKSFNPLEVHRLRQVCDPEQFSFKTTEELEPLDNLIGQQRALEAIKFGTNIDTKGFHLFVLGPAGCGRHTAVDTFLKEEAAKKTPPDDWVYVNNFEETHKPIAIRMQIGQGIKLRDSMDKLIADLLTAIPSMFESDEYRNRRRALDNSVDEAQEKAFEELKTKAAEQSIGILRTPMGFSLAPLQDGKPIKPEDFNALPEDDRKKIEANIDLLQKDLEEVLQKLPLLRKDYMDNVRALNSEFAEIAVNISINEIMHIFSDHSEIKDYLQAVKHDLINNVEFFLGNKQEEGAVFSVTDGRKAMDPFFRRYKVNVLLTQHEKEAQGAPVIFEDYPTLSNLVGRIEHISQQGALITDFTLIKAGALHRANGGYLVLDARRVLSEPFTWEALKRSLRSDRITIRSAAEQLGISSTISLEPDPIPLSVKVILVGERLLYYLLVDLDPDFQEIFKVNVDFDEDVERSGETIALYAQLISSLVRKEKLKDLTSGAVAAVIEEASRLCRDSEKLSLKIGDISDLLHEANLWARNQEHKYIEAQDVEKAIENRAYRSDRIREKSLEQITRDIILIDTDGEAIGQINGLSVLSIGNFQFGRPTRITARVRMGSGKVVDIEREVKLGGPIHTKGVLILSSFLASHYALNQPVSLWASLVFEQTYGGVDGDSASSAELYALLSALSGVPIKQGYAVTGSVNQLGQVQAIGGVNEKIEGFFDVCQARGLTGEQGVLIPQANIRHLMLRKDIVKACDEGKFGIFAISTIDQGIEVLTGISAGTRDEEGNFPENTINHMVEAQLINFATRQRDFNKTEKKNNTPKTEDSKPSEEEE